MVKSGGTLSIWAPSRKRSVTTVTCVMRQCWLKTEDETNKRLVAYVVRSSQATWNVDARAGQAGDLRRLLERYLPLYMCPAVSWS